MKDIGGDLSIRSFSRLADEGGGVSAILLLESLEASATCLGR